MRSTAMRSSRPSLPRGHQSGSSRGPNTLPGYDKAGEGRYEYDPAKAKQLLEEAGFASGVDGGEMLVAQTGAMEQMAQSIQTNLAAVGIRIKLRGMDTFSLSTNWPKSNANAMLQYMSIPSIDPMTSMQRLFLNPHWMVGGPDATVQKLTHGLDDSDASPDQIAAQVTRTVNYATDMEYCAQLLQGVGGLMSSSKVQNLDHLPTLESGVADLRNVYMTTK